MSLSRKASAIDLEKAIAENHSQLFEHSSISSGGRIYRKEGIRWTSPLSGNTAMVLFPELSSDSAGIMLDQMLDSFRKELPDSIGCWSLDPTHPEDLSSRLLARGFKPGWKPGWMALELDQLRTGFQSPENLTVSPDNITDINNRKDIPYSSGSNLHARTMAQYFPGIFQRFVAKVDGEIVGQSAVFFSDGPYGIAGIYDVGVVETLRGRGIGKALVHAACMYAREKGYNWAMLNATNRGMYEQLGFKWINNGMTWWMNDSQPLTIRPEGWQIGLAEAIGRGDLQWIKGQTPSLTPEQLNATAINGMRYLEIAVYFRQIKIAEWMIHAGTDCQVLDAWDLGWKDRAANLLEENPKKVNYLYEGGAVNLLHLAVERNDLELARLALRFGIDLFYKDKVHNSTPLGWAEFFKRPELINWIKSYQQ